MTKQYDQIIGQFIFKPIIKFCKQNIKFFIKYIVSPETRMDILIGGQFKILKKIGSGSFGQLYEAVSTKRGHKVAIKLQNCNAKYQQLLYQASVLLDLQGAETVTDKGVPNVYSKGTEGQFNYLVMDLLGLSLEALLRQCDGNFTLKTTLMLADQMLRRIQFVHSRGYVHRDIKPQNFLVSNKNDRKIYLIDFGLSRKYLKDGKHIPYAQGKGMIGTVRYASLNNHYGIEPTRRDDIESWFYCIVYFYKSELPWQNQKALTKKQKSQKIMGLKLQHRPEILCKTLPPQFANIHSHIRGLKYQQKPNYQLIKQQIKNCMKNKQIQFDYNYDWEVRKEAKNKYEINKSA